MDNIVELYTLHKQIELNNQLRRGLSSDLVAAEQALTGSAAGAETTAATAALNAVKAKITRYENLNTKHMERITALEDIFLA